MAIPRFAGFGYQRGAEWSRHAASLGQFAGMDMPNISYSGGGSGTHRQPSGVRGLPGTPHHVMENATKARSYGASRWPTGVNYAGSQAAGVGPVNALAYQGQATAVNAARPLPGQALAQGRQARSDMWQQAKGQWAAGATPLAPSTAGFRSLSQPAPPPQLALNRGPLVMGAPQQGVEPMSRSGLGTWPTVDRPPAPLSPFAVLTGDWGTQPERPPTRVSPMTVGAALPSSRPPEGRTDPFAAAQGGLPPTSEQPDQPILPTTAAPRSRRTSFRPNPDQGSLPGI
jgi:hypothetical protein